MNKIPLALFLYVFCRLFQSSVPLPLVFRGRGRGCANYAFCYYAFQVLSCGRVACVRRLRAGVPLRPAAA